jgi:hypothetical protein
MKTTESIFRILALTTGMLASESFTSAVRAQIFVLGESPVPYVGYVYGISEYTTSGKTLNASLIDLPSANASTPFRGLAYDGNGHLFVFAGTVNFGYSTNFMSVYSTSGQLLNNFYISETYPTALAVDDDALFVLDASGKIGKYTTSGLVVNSSFIAGLNGPLGLKSDGNGCLFVVNFGNGTVGKYTTSGDVVNASLISGLNAPTALAVDRDGYIFVASGNNIWGNLTIGKYTASGSVVNASLVQGQGAAYDMALDGAGNLFVLLASGASDVSVAEYTTSGQVVNTSLISGISQNSGSSLSLVVVPPSNGNRETGTNVVSDLSIALTGFQGTNTAKAVRIDTRYLLASLNGVLSNSITGILVTNNFGLYSTNRG